MTQDIQNPSEWEFAVVRCEKCKKDSTPFIFKKDLTGDEQIDYIKKFSDYEFHEEGGMICNDCNESKIVEEEYLSAVV